MFAGVSNAIPHMASGRLRVLAVSTGKRTTALPQVPTLAEAALPGFDYAAWAGYLAPAGTPAKIVGKLHAELIRAVANRGKANILSWDSSGHQHAENSQRYTKGLMQAGPGSKYPGRIAGGEAARLVA